MRKERFKRVSDVESIRSLEGYFKKEGYTTLKIAETLGCEYATWRHHVRETVSNGKLLFSFAKKIDKALGDKGFDLYYMTGVMSAEDVEELKKENQILQTKLNDNQNQKS